VDSQHVSQHQFDAFMEELNTFAVKQLNATEAEDLMVLARLFFTYYPLEELVGRHFSDVFGGIYHWWRFIQQFDGQVDGQIGSKPPKLRVFNPVLAEDGWVCPHTVIIVLQKDMPFLVDSIRIEMNRRNIAIHGLKSTVMNVRRDDKHKLISLTDSLDKSDDAQAEALIFLEISLHSQENELNDLRDSLLSVLAEVSSVVKDYQPMMEQIVEIEKNLLLASSSAMAPLVKESQEFIRWLMANHFTFLGYSEYEFVESDKAKQLREICDKRLGVFAFRNAQQSIIDVSQFNEGMARFHLVPQIITFSKSSMRARVHRHAYSDYVVIKKFNANGDVIGEYRFMGLYTSMVYSLNPIGIPLIREKINKVIERSGLNLDSYYGKSFKQILETFPRDEIFLSGSSELYDTLMGVTQINERAMVKLFIRRDLFGKFVTCLIYIPRDYFSTKIRLKIQELIGNILGTNECDFTTLYSESILARVYLVFKLGNQPVPEIDMLALQSKIVEIARSWEDQLQYSLIESQGEEKAMRLLHEYRNAFASSYQEQFDSRNAVQDILIMDSMTETNDIAMSFYQPVSSSENELRFKIFHENKNLELSDVIPVLEHLGLRVLSESSHEIRRTNGNSAWLHDFHLEHHFSSEFDIHKVKQNFQDAFAAIWRKRMDSDPFNRLVLSCGLKWQEVVLLRAYACYMRQTLFNFADTYIANALVNHAGLTQLLINLFNSRFDPSVNQGTQSNQDAIENCRQKILDGLNKVENLNEDRIVRRYLAMIDSSVRTNFFQINEDGTEKNYLSIKLSPRTIPDIPEPRPLYEIFVFSPEVEGVHLRSAKVARGGLRWSDRLQDYRTEVLGLVKAQQVKNAVIVPNGAKGGFVCKRAPQTGGRDAILKEGIECYKTFIRGLLDLTDNLVDGKIKSPASCVRFDEDDPYLVVAADKGTATFSDIANSLSAEYNFWLGDAFASGGSQGYDHKAMGITARGGWISVQRHFKEKNINVQQDPISIVGIGDMSGDVFGNGLLLSQTVLLVAAFDHRHIFIDPEPDPENSFIERKRLFKLPRSSWADYDAKLISQGGGVFSRDLKSIAITPRMQTLFDIQATLLTPTELITALLKSPVDLIWNGGIGTYVKSSMESHADVGDKANDSLRVNGNELRCKVFGEGGNLGMTQRGRIEYCLNGGSCNTDFIDNAGGVDCSDHEVNAKILLNEVVANGDLTQKQRNQLLVEMTDNVAQLVLENNYRQTQAISVAQSEAFSRSAEYRRFMNALQTAGRLNRKLEFLPNDDALLERQTQGKGLTRPELAILVSYAKAMLKEDLAISDIADDGYIANFIEGAFPKKLSELYPDAMRKHRLRREIVATQIANDIVNNMGITFVQRLMESTGAKSGDVAKAYIIARDIYRVDEFQAELEKVDYRVDPQIQLQLVNDMMRRVRRAARWFLRNRRSNLNPSVEVNCFAPAMAEIAQSLPTLLQGDSLIEWQNSRDKLQEAGLPENLIVSATRPANLYSGLSVAESARIANQPLDRVAKLYFSLGNYLSLPWFSNQISDLKVDNFWQAMARETYMGDLEAQLRTLTISLIRYINDDSQIATVIEQWSTQHQLLIGRWKTMVNELQAVSGTDFAMFSVALRDLLDLAQASQHNEFVNR
jgi:glutamate dehydrogenase